MLLMKLRTAILILVAAAIPGGAQTPPAAPAGGRGPAPIKSPEVSADGKVTFRLRAPNAKEVFVTGIGQRIAMEKERTGRLDAPPPTPSSPTFTLMHFPPTASP